MKRFEKMHLDRNDYRRFEIFASAMRMYMRMLMRMLLSSIFLGMGLGLLKGFYESLANGLSH